MDLSKMIDEWDKVKCRGVTRGVTHAGCNDLLADGIIKGQQEAMRSRERLSLRLALINLVAILALSMLAVMKASAGEATKNITAALPPVPGKYQAAVGGASQAALAQTGAGNRVDSLETYLKDGAVSECSKGMGRAPCGIIVFAGVTAATRTASVNLTPVWRYVGVDGVEHGLSARNGSCGTSVSIPF